MHRIVPGVDGVLTNNDGVVIPRSVIARESVNKNKGWLYLSESACGRYRKIIEARNCRDGRDHYTWAWTSYQQVPGMAPQCIRDLQAEYAFRRGLIGKTVDGVAIVPTAFVQRGALAECRRRIADLQRMKSTLAVERDLAVQQELLVALETTRLPTKAVAKPPKAVPRVKAEATDG